MEYRTSDPQEMGHEDHEAAEETLQAYVQNIMHSTCPDDMMDTLVIMTNIAEIRSLLLPRGAKQEWYTKVAALSRSMLEMLGESNIGKPDSNLENPILYYPDAGGPLH